MRREWRQEEIEAPLERLAQLIANFANKHNLKPGELIILRVIPEFSPRSAKAEFLFYWGAE